MTPGYELSGVGYAYDGRTALRDIDVRLPSGRFYGIVGPNGCGKTTLLDLLAGTRRCKTGTIRLDGSEIRDFSRRDLARLVALVPQRVEIGFPFAVMEVVMMGRHPYIGRFSAPAEKDWQRVTEAMAAIGIDRLRDRPVTELSGGEKQRVIVARALAQDTPVLLLDEATASLDIRYTLQVLRVARALVRKGQKTVVGVMHDLNLAAAYCDELLFMNEGRIVMQGPVADVLTPSTIKAVFDVESEIRPDGFSGTQQVSYRYR